MEYQYDKEVDGLYIWFVGDKERNTYEGDVWPKELKNEIGLLFGDDGLLLGIEVLPASKYFSRSHLDNLSNAD